MEAEQIVKQKWPAAYCRFALCGNIRIGYQIVDPSRNSHTSSMEPLSLLQFTEAEAWSDAATRITKGEHNG